MFKKLVSVWRGKTTLLDETISDFKQMLQLGNDILQKATDVFFSEHKMSSIKQDIYAMDTRINNLEQHIRKKLVEQLSSGEAEPVAACLILMSISKDVERIGDYAKNIYEVFEYSDTINNSGCFSPLQSLNKRILDLYAAVITSYAAEDLDRSKKLVFEIYKEQKLCDDEVRKLLRGQGCSEAAACALMYRFFKRILAHLSNISTSVFMPVTKLDFFDEDARPKQP